MKGPRFHALPPFQAYSRPLGQSRPLALDAAIRGEWQRLSLDAQVRGKRIAIGLGSRGITDLLLAARTLVACVHSAGGHPFVIPAMGSHGGATSRGQLEMLAGLGLTPESLNCPILSSMDVVDLGPSPLGHALYCDKHAAAADGLLLFNRVKAHTSFSGDVESGIHKMLAIGLGKEKAATWMHAGGPSRLAEVLPTVARALAYQLPFLAGFAVVEDAAHQPARLEALTADTMDAREPQLLAYAKSLAPSLPATQLDLLIVDEMGKDISGTGMDTHVIGRMRISGEPEPVFPSIAALVALRLSAATHGNALGIGLADFTTASLAQQIDFTATARNAAATGNLERGRLPLVFPDDYEAIAAAIRHVFRRNPGRADQARILRIPNTLDLSRGWFSPPLREEMRAVPGLTFQGDPESWSFSETGNLPLAGF